MSTAGSNTPPSNRSQSSGESHHSNHSNCSLRGSQPEGVPVGGKGKGLGKPYPSKSNRTLWTMTEVDEFVKLLSDHRASAKDGFKDEMFNKITSELNQKFPSQWVPKTSKSCKGKRVNVQFHSISGL